MKKFYERDLEEIIYTADRGELMDRGLDIYHDTRLLRQVKIGNYGIADLIAINRISDERYPYLDITVIELKESKVGISAFLQAIRYVKGIQRYLIRVRKFHNFRIGIWLIGSEIDNSGSFCFLSDMISCDDTYNTGGIDFYDTFTYEYKIDGIKFKNQYGYCLTDEGF